MTLSKGAPMSPPKLSLRENWHHALNVACVLIVTALAYANYHGDFGKQAGTSVERLRNIERRLEMTDAELLEVRKDRSRILEELGSIRSTLRAIEHRMDRTANAHANSTR
jgi:septal ring factor EnvC (AmiA/AmiB activator)